MKTEEIWRIELSNFAVSYTEIFKKLENKEIAIEYSGQSWIVFTSLNFIFVTKKNPRTFLKRPGQ